LDARKKLEATALEVAGALTAYAFMTGNADLSSQVDIFPNDLARLPDSEIDDRAQAFLDLATALPAPAPPAPSAADVGITPGKLDLLETCIETYNLLLGSPRSARGEKSAATQNLATTLDEIDSLLEKGLDKLILGFRDTDFFKEYQSARKIIDPATPSTEPSAPPPPST
jgi:hypothetical protein